jgi:hypothetical protein
VESTHAFAMVHVWTGMKFTLVGGFCGESYKMVLPHYELLLASLISLHWHSLSTKAF